MKCPNNYRLEEILKIQKEKGKQLELLINHIVETLCKCKAYTDTVYNHIRNNGGNEQDSQDIIQESLLKLIKVLKRGNFRGESSIENYTYGISKNLWRDKQKSYRNKNVSNQGINIDRNEVDTKTPQSELEVNERKKILWKLTDKLGPTCKKVLKFLALGFSHQEIALEFENWTEEKSRKQRSICKQKLRTLIQKDSKLITLVNLIK